MTSTGCTTLKGVGGSIIDASLVSITRRKRGMSFGSSPMWPRSAEKEKKTFTNYVKVLPKA